MYFPAPPQILTAMLLPLGLPGSGCQLFPQGQGLARQRRQIPESRESLQGTAQIHSSLELEEQPPGSAPGLKAYRASDA